MKRDDDSREERARMNREIALKSAKHVGERVTGVENRVEKVEQRVEVVEERIDIPAPPPATPRLPPPSARDVPTVPSMRAAPRPPPRPTPARGAEEAMRRVSESKEEFNATTTAIAVHLGDLSRAKAEERRLYAQAFTVLARELGVEDRLPPQLRSSVPPPPPDAPPPPPPPKPLAVRMDRQNARAVVLELVIAITTLLYALDHLIQRITH